MQKYYRNVYDYIDRFENDMVMDNEEEFRYGDDDLYTFFNHDSICFSPRKAGYSLNCSIDSITKVEDKYKIVVNGTGGEDDEPYEIEWLVKKGSLLDVHAYNEGVACFCPPSSVPIWIKVVDVTEKHLKVIPWGIDAFYVDKCEEEKIKPKYYLRDWKKDEVFDLAMKLGKELKDGLYGKLSPEELKQVAKAVFEDGEKLVQLTGQMTTINNQIAKMEPAAKEFEEKMKKKWGKKWNNEK